MTRNMTRLQNFNPRSREGSDQDGEIEVEVLGKFQSTLPRRERRVLPCPLGHLGRISIHAPAKGATKLRNAEQQFFYFNPRSREGSDSTWFSAK